MLVQGSDKFIKPHIFNPQKIWKNLIQEIATCNNGQKSALPSYDVTLMMFCISVHYHTM